MEGQIHVYWNWIVAVYLFVAGVSAGAFAVSAIAYFLGKEKYANIIRIGAYIAPFPVIVGILALIYDLERPHLFWKLFFSFEPGSVMWLGTWLLLIFSILSFIHFYIWLPERFDLIQMARRLPARLDRIKILRSIKSGQFLVPLGQKNLARKQGLVAGLGILISIGVGIYTGILLGALSARPFWNNPVLPLLFLLSAVKTGTASISLIGHFFNGFRAMRPEEIRANKFMINSVDLILMVFSIIAVFLYIFGLYVSSRSSAEAVHLIMGGEFTFLFWVFVVAAGIVFPFIVAVYELLPYFNERSSYTEHKLWLTGVVTVSVLLGGFMLRYVVIYAGQMSQVISS
jgi:formate-dependent nitrite reductase membrane component NrfD